MGFLLRTQGAHWGQVTRWVGPSVPLVAILGEGRWCLRGVLGRLGLAGLVQELG